MEEFARGFPNQHTTHRDTRYICMQTFVSARGPGNEGGWAKARGTMERGGDSPRSRAFGVGCTRRRRRQRQQHVYIFIRVRSVKHACVHITNACAAQCECMRARTMTQSDDESTRHYAESKKIDVESGNQNAFFARGFFDELSSFLARIFRKKKLQVTQ